MALDDPVSCFYLHIAAIMGMSHHAQRMKCCVLNAALLAHMRQTPCQGNYVPSPRLGLFFFFLIHWFYWRVGGSLGFLRYITQAGLKFTL